MIDFTNNDFIKLREVDIDSISKNIYDLLIPGEEIISSYKALRDYCVFTNKRVIAVNVQGVTGKSKDYTSLPYSKINTFSVETSGVLDLDSELELYYSGLGKVRFEFTNSKSILKISKIISEYLL